MSPIVQWAGGKGQLLNAIHGLMPDIFNHYYEPFVGGGALLFNVAPKEFTINDFNSELIQVYKCFTDIADVEELERLLDIHQANHSEEYYYKIRSMVVNSLSNCEKAARMIYLNHSCFNALYRVNKKGIFNVPFGKKKKVSCYSKSNFSQIVEFFAHSNCKILNGDYKQAIQNVKAGDFVYFDPPYDTWDNKNSFTSYTNSPFGKQQQKELADIFKQLADKGAYVMLSNHNTDYIRELYKDFHIHIVKARRMINSDAAGRGCVEEVIITSYDK